MNAQLLSPLQVQSLVDQWLNEDSTAFDIGGCVAGGAKHRSARLYCKSQGRVILASVPFFEAVFRRLDCIVRWNPDCVEGSPLPNSESIHREIATVSGPVANLLRGERPALNCLSRASGIASTVDDVVQRARRAGWNGKIACTRKTTPGFRLVEKYAVMCGGGDPHRYDLGSSMVMLKDNHIDSCDGYIKKAVSMTKSIASFATKIEVETRDLDEALEAAAAGADVVMLDNFPSLEAKRTAVLVKERFPNVIIELSGGINLENFLEYLDDSVDVVSMGCLTQGYKCIDFSLKILKE